MDRKRRYDSYNDRSSRHSQDDSSWSNKRSKPYGRSSGSDWTSSRDRREPAVALSPVPFTKNLYNPTNTLNEEETAQFRKDSKMIVAGKNVPAPVKSFDSIEVFGKEVLSMLTKQGYTTPTPIQAQGWPFALSGRDMVGIAQTGSGKTLSFVLPALLHAKEQRPLRRGDGPIVLILAPTRELVLQINEVVEVYRKIFKMNSCTVYGGVSSYGQKEAIRNGCEIVVATPGRLIDLYDSGYISLSRVSFLILDEADRMLDMGFEPQLKKIIPNTHADRQTLMWSATWPMEVRNLAMDYMKDFIQVNIGDKELSANVKIDQKVLVIEDNRKKRTELLNLLNEHPKKKFIIFCNTKRMCDDLEMYLQDKDYRAIAIHGDKSQQARDGVIKGFKSGYKDILIATDVAARGLDVKDVYMVINYDFPKQCEDYVHRIGRTARGDANEGKSVSFFTYEDRNNARELIRILEEGKNKVGNELKDLVPRGGSSRGGYARRRW